MIFRNGDSILSEECLKDVIMVYRVIVNISGYVNICFR